MDFYNKVKTRFYSFINNYILSPEQYARKIGVQIGKKCNISTRSFSSEPYLINIGSNVRIAKHVQILTHGGLWSIRNIESKYKGLEYFGKVKIGDNVYIGQGSIIMPGVTIEENCIIGAASIVTKSVPKNSIVAGNPARIVSTMDSFIKNIIKFDTGLHGVQKRIKDEAIKALPDNMFVKKSFMVKE